MGYSTQEASVLTVAPCGKKQSLITAQNVQRWQIVREKRCRLSGCRSRMMQIGRLHIRHHYCWPSPFFNRFSSHHKNCRMQKNCKNLLSVAFVCYHEDVMSKMFATIFS